MLVRRYLCLVLGMLFVGSSAFGSTDSPPRGRGDWIAFNAASGGIGQGSGDLGGTPFLASAGSFAFGMDTLGGLGVGISGYENYHESYISYLPVYAIYPIWSGQPGRVGNFAPYLRSRFLYVFGSGAYWTKNGDYVHGGAKCYLFTFGAPISQQGSDVPWSFSLQGGYFAPVANRDLKKSAYVMAQIEIGAVRVKHIQP